MSVTSNVLGQALTRDEGDLNSGGDPHERWYRFNGKQLGYVGNNGTVDISYSASLDRRTAPAASGQGAFRGGASYGQAYADFDQDYTPMALSGQRGS